MPEFAPGIQNRTDVGDLAQLQPNTLLDFIIQRHKARRAGEHFDVRFGTPETGLYSWATKKELPKPGEKPRALFRQPLHSHGYGSFEGEIPSGYGRGTVQTHRKGKILVTAVQPNKIEFSTADERYPERFVLIKPEKWGIKDWLLINRTPTEAVPYNKVRYKKIPATDVDKYIQQMRSGDSMEAKIDGASSLVQLLKDGVELVSYRTSKVTNRPIVHTERFFGGAGKMPVPPELVGTVLKGELYGVRDMGRGADGTDAGAAGTDAAGMAEGRTGPLRHPDISGNAQDAGESDRKTLDRRGADQVAAGTVIPPQELGGILNATLAESLGKQKTKGTVLKEMLYDIQQLGKQPVDWHVTPRVTRRQMIQDVLAKLPQLKDRFHLSEAAETPQAASDLWQRIQQGQHPLTSEGVVLWPEHGTPMKGKLVEDTDVHITGTFPGEGKYKDTGAGGFTYSLEPGGKTVGRIGTGLSDELRQEAFRDPAAFVGRVARIQSQQQLPSGAYRVPALIALHEDYPVAAAKQAELGNIHVPAPRTDENQEPAGASVWPPRKPGEFAADMIEMDLPLTTNAHDELATYKSAETIWPPRKPEEGAADLLSEADAQTSQAAQQSDAVLARLLQAKAESDRKNYGRKQRIIRQLIEADPQSFMVDSPTGKYHGLTHKPTGFQVHVPPRVYSGLLQP